MREGRAAFRLLSAGPASATLTHWGCHASWSLTCGTPKSGWWWQRRPSQLLTTQSQGVWSGRLFTHTSQGTGLRELSQLPRWKKGFRAWGLSDSAFVIFLKKCQCVFNG